MRWNTTRIRHIRGMSLVETMIAASLLSITALAIGSAVVSVRKLNQTSRFRGQMQSVSLGYLQEFSNNGAQYMVNFNDTNSLIDVGGVFPASASLPLAYSDEWFGNAADCEGCPGRMGYVVQPLYGYRGLFRATIRSAGNGSMGEKEYTFLVSGGSK